MSSVHCTEQPAHCCLNSLLALPAAANVLAVLLACMNIFRLCPCMLQSYAMHRMKMRVCHVGVAAGPKTTFGALAIPMEASRDQAKTLGKAKRCLTPSLPLKSPWGDPSSHPWAVAPQTGLTQVPIICSTSSHTQMTITVGEAEAIMRAGGEGGTAGLLPNPCPTTETSFCRPTSGSWFLMLGI